MRYPPVRFTGVQARAIARGFAIAASEGSYIIHALAILPDHAHLVIARNSRHIDEIAAHLKSKATRQMTAEAIHPLASFTSATGRMPSPWSRNYWCPFIRDETQMQRVIRYVQDNPINAGLPAQHWNSVVPYESKHLHGATQ